MKHSIIILMISLFFYGCTRCSKDLIAGEMVEIKIEFVGFTVAEINSMYAYRIDKSTPFLTDTFRLKDILFAGEARSETESITDRAPAAKLERFGDYQSYFDNSHLVIDWFKGKDTLSDIFIRKSKGEADKCHEDDPNVRIDELVFIHKGHLIRRGELIQIRK